MKEITFVWDDQKELANRAKHGGIGFDEAKTVFYDEYARLIFDPDHSSEEERFIIMGFSYNLRLLVVCHCYRELDSVIRIISARKASTKEERVYERHRNA